MKHINLWFVTPILAVLVAFVAFGSQAVAFSQLTSTMAVGSQSANVSNLQTFLASNSLVYPSGLVTGYYGPMTEAAVRNFQIGYGISAVGNVGPQTEQAMNTIINSGKNIDVSNPSMYSMSVNPSTRSVTISWNNNEPVKAHVFYSTSQITGVETSQAKTAPYITGTVTTDDSYSMSKAVTIENLQPGTAYSYVIKTTDQAGNVSVTVPQVFATK